MESQKQIDLLLSLWSLKYNFIIALGVTGSGKTHITNIGFYNMLNLCPSSKEKMAIVGNTLSTAYRNVIDPLLHWDAISDQRLSKVKTRYGEHLIDRITGIKIDIYGADNTTSFKKMRGANLFCILCDEATLYNDNAINEISFRLRYKDENNKLKPSFAIMTGNPHKNNSLVKKKIIDNKNINKNLFIFDFWDNPIMTEEYIQHISNSTSGLMKKRLVDNLWVDSSEDSIFPADMISIVSSKKNYDQVIAQLDYAFGGKDTNALTIAFHDRKKQKAYILGYIFKNSIVDYFINIVHILNQYHVKIIHIEDNADKAQFIKKELKLLGCQSHIQYYTEKENKESKISHHGYKAVKYKKVHFLKKTDKLYLDQIYSYTGSSSTVNNDDAPDSFASLMRILFQIKISDIHFYQ